MEAWPPRIKKNKKIKAFIFLIYLIILIKNIEIIKIIKRKRVPGRFQGRFQRGSGALFPEQGEGFEAGSGQGSKEVLGQVPIRDVPGQVPGRVPRFKW